MDVTAFGGIWLLFVLLMQIGVVALVVLGIVFLVRRVSDGSAPSSGARSALEELELRYARGEIDRTTYLQMRDDLTLGAGR